MSRDRIIKSPVVREWEPMPGCIACLDAKRIMAQQTKIAQQVHGQTMKKLAELRAEIHQAAEIRFRERDEKIAIIEELRAEVEKLKFAYSTIQEFESIVGYQVNESFRDGWSMGRTTNKMLNISGQEALSDES